MQCKTQPESDKKDEPEIVKRQIKVNHKLSISNTNQIRNVCQNNEETEGIFNDECCNAAKRNKMSQLITSMISECFNE